MQNVTLYGFAERFVFPFFRGARRLRFPRRFIPLSALSFALKNAAKKCRGKKIKSLKTCTLVAKKNKT